MSGRGEGATEAVAAGRSPRSLADLSKRALAAEYDDWEEDDGIDDGDKAAMVGIGTTLFNLGVQYTQTFGTISSVPGAQRVWMDYFWMPNFGSWFCFDIFVVFPIFQLPEFVVGVQFKVMALLAPYVFLLWLSEFAWSDGSEWRRKYIDEWTATKKQLSPQCPAMPTFPLFVTGIAMSCATLVLTGFVEWRRAGATFLFCYGAQLLYGAVQLIIVGVAKVYYNEYQHEVVNEGLLSEHTIDERPQFFFALRANCRAAAVSLLSLIYLPMCIANL